MKIHPGIGPVGGKAYDAGTRRKTQKAGAAPAQEDSIRISAAQPRSTGAFVDQLRAQIMKDVKAGTPAGELADLKQQVAAGEYDLNVAEIARRILCDFD